jgi:hypothetical protein
LSEGFIKAIRSGVGMEIIAANPNAFVLLYITAQLAQRTTAFNRKNLKPGEAPLGDWKAYGMSRQQYRTALTYLVKHGFLTINPTTKGTIAKLADTRVFDINIEDINHQISQHPTNGQPPPNHRPTTSKNGRSEKVKKSVSNSHICPPSLEEFLQLTDSLKYPQSEAKSLFVNFQQKDWRDVDGIRFSDWERYTRAIVQNWKSSGSVPRRPNGAQWRGIAATPDDHARGF